MTWVLCFYLFLVYLHSTLVRFYVEVLQTLWRRICIYIPHWLDSMRLASRRQTWFLVIYIPHWLDSMSAYEGSIYDVSDLHSTLVRFYGILDKQVYFVVKIYIPHWLDSMFSLQLYPKPWIYIYIPHWLDSMCTYLTSTSAIQTIYIPHWLDSMVSVRHWGWEQGAFTFHTG